MSEENADLPCHEKMVFESKLAAEGVAAAAKWQHNADVKPYKCQYCNLWHLASK